MKKMVKMKERSYHFHSAIPTQRESQRVSWTLSPWSKGRGTETGLRCHCH